MKLPLLLAVAALILWIGSIWPGQLRSGDTWILLDRSPSMGLEPELETWLEQSGLSLEEWKLAVRKQRILSFPDPRAVATPDLAEALRLTREKLTSADRLVVRTDGRALSAFPDPQIWAGIEVQWVPPQAQPRFQQVLAPSTWPASGDLWVRVHMQNANLASGHLDIRDATQQITAVEILNQGNAWFALHLRTAQPLTQALSLQLRWSEDGGQANASLRLLPVGSPSIALIDSSTPADVVRRRLAQGEVLVLASPDFLSWQNLPSDLKIFHPKRATEAKPLWVLLDVSGSMQGEGLGEARSAIAQLQTAWTAGAVYVVPFQQDLLDTIVLSVPAANSKLQQLSAFGPTNLAQALENLAPRMQGSQTLLILSDGAAGNPELDWPTFLRQTLPGVQVFCLPTGPHAEWGFLRGLGEVVHDGDLLERLNQVLSKLQAGNLAAALSLEFTSFPLPDVWQPQQEHPAWEFAQGVEGLMQDAFGDAYLAARRVGPGLLIGLADAWTPQHQELIAPIQSQFYSPGHSGWVGERFLIQHGPSPPRCLQEGQVLQLRMLEAGSTAVWQAPFASPLKSVEVSFENGTRWSAAALTSPEYGNSTQLWDSWLENHRNVPTAAAFRPKLLWASLLLLTMAFVLRKLSHR